MSTKHDIIKYLVDLKKRLQQEMPRISKEIKVYEEKVINGSLSKHPISGSQFNG
jgi:hypothetical protein|tara:strand:- start:1048 stop:1209 length:162 start_codon:yes stop_codon:yes gene_type:complete